MSKSIECRGKCLCGGVEIQVMAAKQHVAACHCSMCRTWSGAPFLAIDGGDDVRLYGEELVSVYASSEWAERGFCKVCGTHLFYRTRNYPPNYELPVGLMEKDFMPIFTTEIFIDRKPGYYDFANETKKVTEAEVFAAYAPPESD